MSAHTHNHHTIDALPSASLDPDRSGQRSAARDQALPSRSGARQGCPLDANDATPYYLEPFQAWFHNHPDGASGMLVQVRYNQLTCERCGEVFCVPPPEAKWDMNRTKRVKEVLRRIQPTGDPWVWVCPSRTPEDGRVYRIRYDAEVQRWTCTCRDWRDFQHRFWGGCKHTRAVKHAIAMWLADHEKRYEVTPPDERPVGRRICGHGWHGTLLTRSRDGVAYLEMQGVVHHVPKEDVWSELTQRGFDVSSGCLWVDVAHDMGKGVAA